MQSAHIPAMELKLLGTFSVTCGGAVRTLPRSRKARAILAYLAMAPNGATRDELCQLLFATAADPRGGLRWSLSRLRSSMQDDAAVYLISGDRLQLSSRVQTDVDRLVRASRDPRTPTDELISLDAAIDGGFLENLSLDNCPEFQAWRLALRSRYLSEHTGLLQRIIRALSATPRAVEYAQRLVSIQPNSETAWARLISQLRLTGDAVQARRAYEMAHRELQREATPLTGLLRKAMETNGFSRADDEAPETAAAQTMGSPPAYKPIIYVAPCRTLDGSAEADLPAITSAIFTSATRFKGCLTMAPDLYRPTRTDAQLKRQADLRLESTIRSDNGGFLIQAALSDDSAAVLFSWQMVVRAGERTALLEQATAYFSSHLEVDLTLALIKVAMDKPETARTAQDRYLLALPQIYTPTGYDADATRKALEAVIDSDPSLGPALCALAWVRSTLHPFNSDPEEIRRTAALARRAVELCPDDPLILGWTAVVIAHADRDVATGQDLVERALSFNPYSPMALIAASFMAHYAGDDRESLELIDRAEAHGVAGPLAFLCLTVRSMCCYQQGRYEDAADWAQRALGHNPTFVIPLRIRTASLAESGRMAEAKASCERLTTLDPSERLGFFRLNSPYVERDAVEKLCSGLGRAGLPD